MKIYVVECMHDYVTQLGWSTSREIAQKKCEEYLRKANLHCWVAEYTTNKNNWCEFDCD